MFKTLIISLLFLSCAKEAERVDKVNSEFDVSFLFEHDGCKVYRFYDVGRYIHFTNCSETITEINCGKNCLETKRVGNNENLYRK